MMSMMYQAYQNHMDLTAPWRSGAAHALKYLNLVPQGVSDKLFGRLAAALELVPRPSLTHPRPAHATHQGQRGARQPALQDHDVYVTHGHNPRDIPLDAGSFGLDEFPEHRISFLDPLGLR